MVGPAQPKDAKSNGQLDQIGVCKASGHEKHCKALHGEALGADRPIEYEAWVDAGRASECVPQ